MGVAQLKKVLREWSDTFEEKQTQTEYIAPRAPVTFGAQTLQWLGDASQTFLVVYAGIVAAIISFGVAICVGYSAVDYALRWKKQKNVVMKIVEYSSDESESECSSEL